MARRTADIVVQDDGRDRGKMFRLTEMSAAQTEKWAGKALLVMAKAGIDLPTDVVEAGVSGLVSYTVNTGLTSLGRLSFGDVEPLLDEMMTCVARVVDPSNPIYARPLTDDDIEEVTTRLTLRGEIIRLHVGFSLPAAPSTSATATATAGGVNGVSMPVA